MAAEAGSSPRESSWSHVRAALELAFEAAPSERDACLVERLGDNPALLSMAREMLADDASDDGYMQPPEPAFSASAQEPELPAEDFGRYTLIRRLGVGGMGAVFLAQRSDGAFRREAALKLLHPGLESAEWQSRFQRERQVQAGLAHPGIASLLDGGTTASGRPFLVVEYVDGQRLDEYCDERRLTVEERIALFLKICSAVQHAHERHVVHRDIKPSNILVSADGEPKLLDFGIAKVLAEGDPEAALDLTHAGARLMTPAYASPEQMRGEPITPASDLYSLAALLQDLLTGRTPHDLAGLSPAQAERRVCEESPTRPSLVASSSEGELAASRGATPRALRRSLQGDLDRIVLMGLRKDPRRRYASVAALAQDLERYLDHRPVLARPDTALYRVSRFVRRNRVLVAAASVVFLVLSFALAATLTSFRASQEANALASDRLDNLRSFRSDMLEELRRTFAVVPGAAREAGNLMRVTLEHLDRERASAADDPALLLELAKSYAALAAVTGIDADQLGGGLAAAREGYAKSREAALQAHALTPDDAAAAQMAWSSCAMLGFQIGTEDVSRARELQQEALDILASRDLEGDLPDGPNLLHARATVYTQRAAVELDYGAPQRAREYALLALEHHDEHVRLRPSMEIFVRGDRASVSAMLGTIELQLGHADLSLERLEEARSALELVVGMHPSNSDVLRILPGIELRRGRTLAALDRSAEAEEALRSSHAELLRLAAANPGNVLVVLDVASGAQALGDFLLDQDRPAEALPVLSQALEPLAALADQEPGRKLLEVPLGHLELLLGRADSGDNPESARQRLQAAVERLASLASGLGDDFATLSYLAHAHALLGELQASTHLEEALEHLAQARTLLARLAGEGRGGPGLSSRLEAVQAGLARARAAAR